MDEPIVVRRPIGPPPLALRLAAVLVVPLLLYALVATGQKALDNYRLNQDADGLRAQVLGLQQQNIDLQQQIEQARTDPAIETIAREQLGLILPGDHPVVVFADSGAGPGQTAGGAPPDHDQAPVAPPAPPLTQWWDYFFG